MSRWLGTAWRWPAKINLFFLELVELLLVLFGEEVFVAAKLRSVYIGVFPAGVVWVLFRGCTAGHNHYCR